LIIPFDAGTHQFSGVSMLVNTANYLILINSRLAPDKYRSTLIHEFAHILLHQLPSPDMETEANEFEGEFAMPSDIFVPEVKGLKNAWSRSPTTMLRDLSALKRYWKMPISAIVTHASKLKLFTDWETRQIWMRLADAGITRKTEPFDPTIESETPSLIRELVEYHISELGFSIEQMSAFLGMHPEDFLETYKPNNQPLTIIKNVPKLSLAR
jgi:Zn-dependent peptidase ImmA (M78 family)